MRLLVLENEPSSRRGGQELSLLDVCRGLAQRGHQVDFVYNCDGDLLDQYRIFCSSITNIKQFTINRSAPLSFQCGLASGLSRLLSTTTDLVYINDYHNALFGSLLARLKRVPLVCHLRLFPPGTFCGQWRIGLRAVTRFIAVSHATRNAYMQAGFSPDSIGLVYNGIDLERFNIKGDRQATRASLGLSPDEFVVIFAGRVDRHKNIEMLLQSFAQINQQISKSRLLIAGGPLVHQSLEDGARYIDELKTYCIQLKIDDRTSWLGRRNDLPELFRAADVSVLPSKMPETFGRTLAESIACGTPALGYNHGGIPEVLGIEFARFIFNSPDELTAILMSLVGWRTKNPALEQRCRKYVEENFNVGKMVDGVEAELGKALDFGPRRLGPSRQVLRAWHNEHGLYD